MKTISLPGSKSLTNRALLLAALGKKPVRLQGILCAEDSQHMRVALEQLGVKFREHTPTDWEVIPALQREAKNNPTLFLGNSGTASRFLAAASLVIDSKFTLAGIDRLHERPFADLFLALRTLGVKIVEKSDPEYLPATFEKTPEGNASEVTLSGKVSSQFLSGLLLVAPFRETALTINFDEVPSWPYVQMTLELLRTWGVAFSQTPSSVTIQPGWTSPSTYQIPADMSSASYPLAWACLTQTPLTISNWGEQTLQGDEQFREIIERVGGVFTPKKQTLELQPPKTPNPVGDYNWSAMPDVSMTGMVLAATTQTTTTFTGLESLRVKECDRLQAMEDGFSQLGIRTELVQDDLTIHGRSRAEWKAFAQSIKTPIQINDFDDHRIAMSFGILAAAMEVPITFAKSECVAKTWPEFWVELADWQNKLRPVVAGIIRRQQEGETQFLLVEKPRSEHAWQFPQGGVDKGETAQQALVREIREELGDDLQVDWSSQPRDSELKYLFPSDFNRPDHIYTGARVQFWTGDWKSGAPQPDGVELVGAKWMTPNEACKLITPYLGALITGPKT